MKKLILIDGNAIIHRAYHAFPPFKTSQGQLVNAVYGFASMLLTILNNQKPDYIAVSFDTKEKTFRHEQYVDYKATRVKAPDDLYSQIPLVYEVVKTFQIPIFVAPGYEADDVLGTLARQAEKEPDVITYIVTGDMDISQLISPRINILLPQNGFSKTSLIDDVKVLEKYGLRPDQVPDMKGLQGDTSDNIKGVPGIGPKTARTLLQKYKTIEGIYENIEEIEGAVHEKLKNHEQDARTSKKLATLVTDLDIPLDLDECCSHEFDKEKVRELFARLEFKSLLRKLGEFENHASKIPAKTQGTLF